MIELLRMLFEMADIPIHRKRPALPTIYLVCTVLGHEEAYTVHSRSLAAWIERESRQPGRAPKRVVSREEYERVKARIAAAAVFQAAKEREIAPGPTTWIERSAKEE